MPQYNFFLSFLLDNIAAAQVGLNKSCGMYLRVAFITIVLILSAATVQRCMHGYTIKGVAFNQVNTG